MHVICGYFAVVPFEIVVESTTPKVGVVFCVNMYCFIADIWLKTARADGAGQEISCVDVPVIGIVARCQISVHLRLGLGAIVDINVGSFHCDCTVSHRMVKEGVHGPDRIVLALMAA